MDYRDKWVISFWNICSRNPENQTNVNWTVTCVDRDGMDIMFGKKRWYFKKGIHEASWEKGQHGNRKIKKSKISQMAHSYSNKYWSPFSSPRISVPVIWVYDIMSASHRVLLTGRKTERNWSCSLTLVSNEYVMKQNIFLLNNCSQQILKPVDRKTF